MKTVLYKIAVFLNVIVAILLLVTYISVFVSPSFMPFLALLGLIFPILLFVNISFLFFWLSRKNKISLVSFITILLGISSFLNFFALSINDKEIVDKKIKILSYNVRMFNLYNWANDKKGGQKIFEYIKNEDADIICLQEFYSDKNKHNFQDSIIKTQNTKDYIISYRNKDRYSGNAIFSKYPIVNSGFVNIGTTKQKCIYADIKVDEDTFRIYSIHLASIHLSKQDYKNIENIDDNREPNIVYGIGSKLIKAYRNRSREVDAIYPHVQNTPYKTIVCGDFNDIPISYSYKKIRGEYKDAFLESGFGTGGTYNGKLPSLRIDYILHSPKLVSSNFKIGDIKLSDHFPISCSISNSTF